MVLQEKHSNEMRGNNNQSHTLEEVEVEKDLGVHIDSNLKFTTHCQEKINKANKILGFVRHFKHLDKEIFLML